MKNVQLYKGLENGTFCSVNVRFEDNGTLCIEGHDMGRAVKDFFGTSEYEYFCRIEPNELIKLYDHFKINYDDKSKLLNTLKVNYSNRNADSEIRELLKNLDIKFEHSVYY